MSDIIIRQEEIEGGLLILINPPSNKFTPVNYRFVNKIINSDRHTFFYPAVYGNFNCMETAITSEKLYSIYEEAKKTYAYENIFVFEISEHKTDGNSIAELAAYSEKVISFQNSLKGNMHTDSFEAFLSSDFYNAFLMRYSFTASEKHILKGLFKYAFLSDMDLCRLIADIESGVILKENTKNKRKEVLNALRNKLS